jgi:hypothetical protein
MSYLFLNSFSSASPFLLFCACGPRSLLEKG